MFRSAIVLIASAVAATAASAPVRQVSVPAIMGQKMPCFYEGYLYATQAGGRVTLFGRDGATLVALAIPGKGNGNVEVYSLAVDSDNTLAIAWRDSRSSGIDIRDSTGALIRSIDTARYIPNHLAFGQDHSLWTFGVQLDATKDRGQKPDYPTVRKYSLDGRQLGAYLPRSLFPAGLDPGWGGAQERRITVTSDRVGVEADSGTEGDQREWVELDLKGNLTGRWRLDPAHGFPGVAFTSDDRAYVFRLDRKDKTYQVFELNRDAARWDKVDGMPSANIYGADADQLVFADWAHEVMHLSWYPQPAALTAVSQKIP